MKLIIANWKNHPATVADAVALASAEDVSGLVICPPFPFFDAVRGVIRNAVFGTQDFDPERTDGVRYAIIGHSDRRKLGETDAMVAEKVAAAVRNSITPIICIGETRAEHDTGKSREVIKRQLTAALSLVASGYSLVAPLVIAYEPVWAISTEPGAEPDTPENAVAMIQFMKETLVASGHPQVAKYIYGGSVTPANAASFLKESDIEGALVGGASLQPGGMRLIMKMASQL